MKEIDFIPEWYKSGKRRQVSYRTQYFALSCVFVVILVWSFVTGHSLNRAVAQFDTEKSRTSEDSKVLGAFLRIKSEQEDLRNKSGLINRLDSRIDIAVVLAEMSHLFDEKVVLKSVKLTAEEFEETGQKKAAGGSVIRPAGRRDVSDRSLMIGSVRFKITLEGVASSTSDYTKMVLGFEESEYFRDVSPSMHSAEIKSGGTGMKESIQVSEFKIVCYLANYKEDVIRKNTGG